MNYFKNTNNQIFAYDDEQVAQGYGKDLTQITEGEKEAIINPPKSPEELLEIARTEMNNAIQNLLDTTAQSFRYDNIVSVRSYAGYVNPFQEEAQTLAIWASSCWVKAGEIEAEVTDGTRAIPTVDEVLAELPIYGV